ncbi:MAG TPA: site-specific integrase [Afifellaceae bacterium]|nr:site-specific integrase [Afifellaceae bacterium]
MPRNMTAAEIAELAKEPNTEGYSDGLYWAAPNLYVQVRGNSASWLLRYTQRGRHQAMGLGPLRLVTFTEAKRRAIRYMRWVHDGYDPRLIRKAEREAAEAGLQAVADASRAAEFAVAITRASLPTFREAATRFIAEREAGWKDISSTLGWTQRLRDYAYGTIGDLPVDQINVDHIVAILKPVWHTRNPTAQRVRSQIDQILEWCAAHGWRSSENPAAWRGALVIKMGGPVRRERKHFKALPYPQVPRFWQSLAGEGGPDAAALRFQILTVARPTEARLTRWEELDLDQQTWIIPGVRMKSGRQHRIPLSDAAVEVLRSMGPAKEGLVFQSKSGRPLSPAAKRRVIEVLGFNASPHGFRSSFADWSREAAGADRELRELSLAHQERSSTVSAYSRSDLLEPRRVLMARWAAFVTGVDSR